MFVPKWGPSYSEQAARDAIAASRSYAETLRRLGMCPSGGNWRTLKHYATVVWNIPVAHFDPWAAQRDGLRRHGLRTKRPLDEILVEGSTYSRRSLKARLYAEGVKQRRCELCGQGELWHGRRMSLILDHINGERADNRLENLRVVCPNCAATLPTHCGSKNRVVLEPRPCARCGEAFMPQRSRQRFCSRACAIRYPHARGPRPELRRAERPLYEQLVAEVRELGWSAVGRRYGVSDNAIRKWVRAYERELAAGDGRPTAGPARGATAG